MMNRNDKLVERFFDILEEGGEYTEIFLIRDLLMKEYINGAFSQVEILQIDDIIEEQVYNVRDGYFDSDNAEYILNEIYGALAEEEKDLDKVFELVNAYGDMEESNAYAYYCIIRELERVTGENYIELCI